VRVAREKVGSTRVLGGEADCKIARMTKAAQAVLADAVRWYEERRRGLGAELCDAVAATPVAATP
jgi:hypothetical protein